MGPEQSVQDFTDTVVTPHSAMNQTEPAIAGTLKRARNLMSRAAGLADSLRTMADRVEGVPPTAGPGVPPSTPEKAYGPGLLDAFLKVHDDIESDLNSIDTSIARLNQIF